MSTPTTLKQIELARKRSDTRTKHAERQQQQQQLGGWVFQPAGLYQDFNPSQYTGRQFRDYRNNAGLIDFTDHKELGREYTSFERKPPSYGQQTRKFDFQSLTKVKELPSDVGQFQVLLDTDSIECFVGRQHWLSNFYPAPMLIDGFEYPSVEHYYQACKLYTLGGSRLANQIRRIPDAGNVKVATKRLLQGFVPKDVVEEWKVTKGPVILHHAIVHKFVQNPKLLQLLLQTGDGLLAHTYEMDRMFATGCNKEKMLAWVKENEGEVVKIPKKITVDTLPFVPLMGQGKNILGVLNMNVRELVRAFQSKNKESEDQDPILAAAMATLQLQKNPEPKEHKSHPDPKDIQSPSGDSSEHTSPDTIGGEKKH